MPKEVRVFLPSNATHAPVARHAAAPSHPGRRPRWALTALLATCLLAATGGSLPPAPAQAATVLALDLAGLVERADLIVLGRAKARHGRWARYGNLIVTDVEFAVQRALKGKAALGDRIQITRLGGAIDGQEVALTVPGEATFQLEQPVLVFLRRAQGELRVVGMAQGLMPIEGEGSDAMVLPTPNAPTRLQRGPDGTMKSVPEAAAEPRRLLDVVADVERLVVGVGR